MLVATDKLDGYFLLLRPGIRSVLPGAAQRRGYSEKPCRVEPSVDGRSRSRLRLSVTYGFRSGKQGGPAPGGLRLIVRVIAGSPATAPGVDGKAVLFGGSPPAVIYAPKLRSWKIENREDDVFTALIDQEPLFATSAGDAEMVLLLHNLREPAPLPRR